MWYIYFQIGMYFLIPIFRCLMKNKDDVVYYLIFFIVIFFCLKPLSQYFVFIDKIYTFIKSFGFESIFGFSVYFVLGGLIKNYNFLFDKLSNKKTVLAAVILMAFMMICNVVYAWVFTTNTLIFLDYLQLFILVVAVCIFIFFERKEIELSNRCKKIVNDISSKTMGIYFLHLIPYYILCHLGIYSISNSVVTIVLSSVINFISIISIIKKDTFFI